ncbi:uncharacterized protein [Sinocyclocheilus grahami]|uniref:uncharacterized protein n=1 Tax=Sinocyclocheilus grahami TaxID=75366 RepID=UPI0007AD5D9C|nr:PREDICTED: uncharacterized protein LOC107585429 [Sinocyclocheilus grahami]
MVLKGYHIYMVYIVLQGSYEELSVIQSPSSITVNEGESDQISCCWSKTKEENSDFKVAWYKDKKRIPVEKRLYQTSPMKNCSFLKITNIVKNDTGDYVCKVIQDIPVLLEYEGQKTYLYIIQIQTTTEDIVHMVSSPTTKKPGVVDHPKRNPEDKNYNYLDPKGSSREVVIIYIFRSLPFICLLAAFFYLNRNNKLVSSSRPAVEHAVKLGEGPDEDLEVGETQRNETEEVKQGENISEQEKGRVNNEKPEVTVATEEETDEEKPTAVVVSIEQGASPVHDNENKTISVLNTDEKTLQSVEEGTVSVLGDLVSALRSEMKCSSRLLCGLLMSCLCFTAVEHAVKLGEGPDEDLEVGETQRNETEEVKQGENISEQEKGRVNNEKPEVTVATEEETDEEKPTAVVVSIEQGASPVHDNENKTISVLNTDEKTLQSVEEGTVSVLGDLVSALRSEMKCSSRLLCGLLMSCLCFTGSYEELSVIQSPSSITVNEGESDQISCCWSKTKEENSDFKVAWYKDKKRIPVEKRLYQTSPMKNCSFLKITNIVKNDTGDYVCKVIQDIPVLLEYEGQKTYLNVCKGEHSTEATTQSSASTSTQKTQINGTTGPPSPPILPLSLAAAIGLLTLCLAFSVCKMRNSCKKSAARRQAERFSRHRTLALWGRLMERAEAAVKGKIEGGRERLLPSSPEKKWQKEPANEALRAMVADELKLQFGVLREIFKKEFQPIAERIGILEKEKLD